MEKAARSVLKLGIDAFTASPLDMLFPLFANAGSLNSDFASLTVPCPFTLEIAPPLVEANWIHVTISRE